MLEIINIFGVDQLYPLKLIIYISFLIFCLSETTIFAQGSVSATMRVSATIVSGVTLNNVESINMNLAEEEQVSSSFGFTTPKYLDSFFDIENLIVLRNEFGDEISISSESQHTINDGTHQVDLNTTLSAIEKDKLKGHYRGNLITTINYL